jgi:signal transduction histidine kinase
MCKLQRGFLLAVVFLFVAIFSNAQDYKKLDSLLSELNNQHHDTIIFELLLEIGDYYYFNDFDKAIAYFEKAKELAGNNLKNGDEALQRKYIQQKAKAIRYIAYVYQNKGDLVTALDLYFQTLAMGESINCSLNIYNSLNNIAIINYTRGNYDIAHEYFIKAIDITEKTGNRFGRMKLYNNMGVLLYDMGKLTDSIPERIEYFKASHKNFDKALALRIEFNDEWGQMLCYNNLGNLIRDGAKLIDDSKLVTENLLIANDYYNQSFVLAEKLNDLMGMSKAKSNKSELYIMLYEISDNQNYADSAVFYAIESYRYASELNSLPQKNDAALAAKKAFEILGNTTKALDFANIYINTSDELFSEEKTKSLDEMRVKYETEKKENEIQLLSRENELKEIQISNEKKEKFLFVIIAIAAIVLSAMLLFLFYNRHQTDKILKIKNEELRDLNATKDKFISILAHDLKNPFSAFLNISTVLKNEYDTIDDNSKQKYISTIYQSALRINSLLKNMLEWAVIKHNTTKINIERINVFRTVNYVIDTLAFFIAENNANVRNTVHENIYVYANNAYLTTIFNNLITNAVKFSDIHNTVTINAVTNNDKAIISVTDNGIGIAPADIEKIFRLDIDTGTIGKANHGKKGTGMGLILCKELIEKMNGDIHIESEPGKGSKIIFTLPIVKQ